MTAELKNWQTSMLNGRKSGILPTTVYGSNVFLPKHRPRKKKIKAFLSRKYPGKELIYQISINPSLLGGVRIRIGNEEYDWTFAARIRQLKDAVGQI